MHIWGQRDALDYFLTWFQKDVRIQCVRPTGNLKKETEKNVLKDLIVSIPSSQPCICSLIPKPGRETLYLKRKRKSCIIFKGFLNIIIKIENILIKCIFPCLGCFLIYPTGHWVQFISWNKKKEPFKKFERCFSTFFLLVPRFVARLSQRQNKKWTNAFNCNLKCYLELKTL